MKDAIHDRANREPAATVRTAIVAVLGAFLVVLPPLHLSSPDVASSGPQQALIAAVLVSVAMLGAVLYWLEGPTGS